MSELEAGRELDALVAEKVMGCLVSAWSIHMVESEVDLAGKEWRPGLFPPNGFPCEVLMADMDGDCPGHKMLTDAGWAGIPHYSTDIAWAFGVAHHLSPSLLLGLSGFYVGGDPNKRAWRAIFSSTNGKAPLHVKAEADTPALAICRAALKAVGAA